ncbi:F0F1 ATP synthase subunit beta, partial [Gluconobacter albidus]
MSETLTPSAGAANNVVGRVTQVRGPVVGGEVVGGDADKVEPQPRQHGDHPRGVVVARGKGARHGRGHPQ